MTVCVLYQPSTSPSELLIQIDNLLRLTENFYVNESDIPADTKPVSYMVVNIEAARQIMAGEREIPANFGLKVKVNVAADDLPQIPLHTKTREHLGTIGMESENAPDILTDAYIQKYSLLESRTICIIWDQKCNRNINGVYLNNAVNIMCQRRDIKRDNANIIVFIVNPDGKPSPISGTGLTVISGLAEIQIMNIVSRCKNHVLVGSNIGLICALLSSEAYCVYPNPWRVEDPSFKLAENWHGIKYNWPYTRYFDHVYFINLDRRTDRKAHMERQLDRFNISASRIQAIDGKNLKWQKEFGVWSKFWNEGAFACCLSHRQALADAYNKGYEKVLILEDDAVLQDNFFEVLAKAWEELPADWHMLYLAANHGKPGSPTYPTEADKVGDHLYRLKGSLCTHAIIVNKICYQPLLNYLAIPYGPLDIYYSLYQQIFQCYVANPGLASQLDGHSDIVDQYVDYSSKVNYIDYSGKTAEAVRTVENTETTETTETTEKINIDMPI